MMTTMIAVLVGFVLGWIGCALRVYFGSEPEHPELSHVEKVEDPPPDADAEAEQAGPAEPSDYFTTALLEETRRILEDLYREEGLQPRDRERLMAATLPHVVTMVDRIDLWQQFANKARPMIREQGRMQLEELRKVDPSVLPGPRWDA